MAGIRFDDIALNQFGQPIQSAQISVCSGTGHPEVPCTPLATVFSDEALTIPLSQPLSSGPLGNFGFYAAAGDYTYSVAGPGLSGANFSLTLEGGGSQRKTCSIVLGADNGAALASADIAPQLEQCFVPQGGTVLEVTVSSNIGICAVTPAIQHGASNLNLLSGAILSPNSGGIACANVSGSLGLDGVTLCTATLINTALSTGDWLGLASGGISTGNTTRLSVAITWQVS